jgi:hypothetical protein
VERADHRASLTVDDAIIAPILAGDVLGAVEVKASVGQGTLQQAQSQLRPVKALMSVVALSTISGGCVCDRLRMFSFCKVATEEQMVHTLGQFPGAVDFVVMSTDVCCSASSLCGSPPAPGAVGIQRLRPVQRRIVACPVCRGNC